MQVLRRQNFWLHVTLPVFVLRPTQCKYCIITRNPTKNMQRGKLQLCTVLSIVGFGNLSFRTTSWRVQALGCRVEQVQRGGGKGGRPPPT